jgi:Ca2+-binding EF-hand superfamily protein
MRKRKLFLATGALVALGAVAAISAPGPRGHHGEMWGQPDEMGAGPRGHRGWFGSRSITADEYDTRTRERFARLDKNGDGILDASEIQAGVAQRRGRNRGPEAKGPKPGGMPGGLTEGYIQRFGDKDGKVTKDAMLTEAKRQFAQLDLDNDGKITDADLPPMMRGKGTLKSNGPAVPGPMGRMIAALREADVKGDGVITQEAYLAQRTKRFDELDRNKDGVVDKADVDLLRKEMSDYQTKRFLHMYGADAQGTISKEQFYKIAKERFARLDRKGEGKITFDRDDGGRRGGWFGRRDQSDRQDGGADQRRESGPPAQPKN